MSLPTFLYFNNILTNFVSQYPNEWKIFLTLYRYRKVTDMLEKVFRFPYLVFWEIQKDKDRQCTHYIVLIQRVCSYALVIYRYGVLRCLFILIAFQSHPRKSRVSERDSR